MSLHNSGVVLSHRERALPGKGVEWGGVSQVYCSPHRPGPCLLPPHSSFPRLTGRARLQEKEMGVPCMVRREPRLGRSDAKA